LGNLANLEHLHLYDNQLSGAIPESLVNLRNLQDEVIPYCYCAVPGLSAAQSLRDATSSGHTEIVKLLEPFDAAAIKKRSLDAAQLTRERNGKGEEGRWLVNNEGFCLFIAVLSIFVFFLVQQFFY